MAEERQSNFSMHRKLIAVSHYSQDEDGLQLVSSRAVKENSTIH